MQRNSKTLILIECAIMVGLATALSFVKIIEMPWGGSVTVLSMLPICLLSIKRGVRWGAGAAFVYSVIQLILDIKYLSYANTFLVAAAILMFDYIVPFTGLGLAGLFRKNGFEGQMLGVVSAVLFRFLCHFFTGIVIWGQWREGMWLDVPAWVYSLAYNSAYMLPETVFTAIGAAILIKTPFMRDIFKPE